MATRPRSSIPAPARPTWRLHASSCRRGCRMKKRKLPPPRLRRRLRNEARSAAAEIIHLADLDAVVTQDRSEEHTSELQSLMRISYAVFCLKQKHKNIIKTRY